MYTPFNIKTDNTFLTSMIKVDDLIEYAKLNNINSLALADTNMYGVMDFYIACINNNIKPIVGLEINYKGRVFLYCKNYDGYKNLLKLNSLDSITYNDLIKYKDNLICIIPYEYKNNYDELKMFETYISYKNSTEKGKLNIENILYANDILCLKKEDLKYLKYLYCIKNNEYIDNCDIEYNDNYMAINKELNNYSIINNEKIANECNLTIPFLLKGLIPKYNCNDSYDYLKKLCIEGLKNKIGDKVPNKYIELLKYELKIIKQMNFCDYFLIVYDYVNYAKKIGGNTCLCRGSAAGSLVSYLINITNTDPIKYGLYFERFLNPERVTMPDIDIDFKGSIREEVVKYCINKYGVKKVAPIITFQTMQAKQVIRDVFKVLDIPDKQKDVVLKMIDSRLSLKDNIKNKKLLDYLNNNGLIDAIDVAQKFEGMKKTSSIHAAGVIMCNEDIDNIIPLKKNGDHYITGIDATYLEKIGLLKMDLLTVRTLDILSDMLEEINLDYNKIPLNNKRAINVFLDGDTLGIFQFEKEGITNTVKNMHPNSLMDIYNALALYRPGPMQNINTYINRKLGKEKITYMHPLMEEILRNTYGVIIYQEQIMEIAKKMANFSLSDADNLRRAMAKKNKDLLGKYKEKFILGCVNNNIDKNIANKIFNLMFSFASYGFNKSHSVVYGLCAYKMAYIKANYPDVYFKHLLKQGICNSKYLYEMKKYGVKIIKPDINKSCLDYVYDNGLVYPISCIKGSEMLAKKIVENKPYKDIYSLFEKIPGLTKEQVEPLVLSGCLDTFGYKRKTIIDNLDELINYGELEYTFHNQQKLRPLLEDKDEYLEKEILNFEYKYLGFYLTCNPVSLYKAKYNSIDLKDIKKYYNKNISLVVIVDRININKKEKPTCFITGRDEFDSIELVLFNPIYEKYKGIKKNDILHVFGKVGRNFDKDEIIVDKINIL